MAVKPKIYVRCKGIVLIFVALVFVVLMGMIALAVDVGFVYDVEGDLQAAVDAAALAAASGLSIDPDTARGRAIDYASKNVANGAEVVLQSSDVQLGFWDTETGFTPLDESSTARPTAVMVTGLLNQARGTEVGLFFAGAFGVNSVDMSASAVAVFGSRDVVLTLDYSGSMSYDSQFIHADDVGLSEVEGYLDQIWEDLGHLWKQPGDPLYKEGFVWEAKTPVQPNLSDIPYPYPSGSWSEYFSYVQTDWYVQQAGYRNMYGYRTLVDYWQAKKSKISETPDLWQTQEQPITAVKNAVTMFLAYMEQEPTDDRIGLAAYTYTDGGGTLEVSLTDNYELIESTSRHRQAGHYDRYTNIAGGIEAALAELNDNGRPGALRLIVLLSDGRANRPWGNATGAALSQAQQAADEGIPILTISLGAGADTGLMQSIADITDGIHFVVPGSDDVSDYEEQLNEIFAQIAGHRPLKLVD